MASENGATQRRNIANLIYQMVEYFMETVTMEQLQSFSSGVPDVMTKIWMTELTLDFLSSITKVYATADVNEQWDFSTLTDTLELAFSKVFKKDMTGNFSIALLSELIQEAVPENIYSIEMNGMNNIIPPERLNVMFSCVLEIFTVLANKLVLDVSWKQHKESQKSLRSSVVDEYILSPTSSKGKKDKKASKKSKKVSKADKKAAEIICSLIAEVPGDEFKKVMAETFRQILSSDEQVTGFLFNARKDKESFEQVAGKFKEYLSMCFAKAWTYSLLEKLDWENQGVPVKDGDLHESIIDFVHIHLPDFTEEEEDKKKLFILIDELSCVLHDTVKQRRSFSPSRENKMYKYTKEHVSSFAVLMNWWVHHQISKLTARMVLTTMEEEMKQCDGPLSKHAKLRFVFILVEKIVLNICHNLRMMPKNIDDLIQRVFDKVLDQVQDTELYLSSQSSGLYKKINKTLLRAFGSPEAVLFLMNSEDPVIEQCIVAVLVRKMVKPPNKQNFIRKIFSFCNIFSKRR